MAVGGGGVHASGHQLRVERGGAHVMCVGGGRARSSVWEGRGTCVEGSGAHVTCVEGGGAHVTCVGGGGAHVTCVGGGGAHSLSPVCVFVHQVAWAPGRGSKGSSFKAYWVLKQGVTVIPWNLVKEQEELNALGDGGEVDLDTLPPGLRFPPPQEGEEVLDTQCAYRKSPVHIQTHVQV